MDKGFYLPILMVLIKLADVLITKVGVEVAGTALCKIGSHQWEAVDNHMYLRVCVRCGATDDIRTNGIDSVDGNPIDFTPDSRSGKDDEK